MQIMQYVYIGFSVFFAGLMFIPRPKVDLGGMTRRQRLFNRWPTVVASFAGVIGLFVLVHPMNFSAKDVEKTVKTDFLGLIDDSGTMMFSVNPNSSMVSEREQVRVKVASERFINFARSHSNSGFGMTLFSDTARQIASISDGGTVLPHSASELPFQMGGSNYDAAFDSGLDELAADPNAGRRHVLILISDAEGIVDFSSAHDLALRLADADAKIYLVQITNPDGVIPQESVPVRMFAEIAGGRDHVLVAHDAKSIDAALNTIYEAEANRTQFDTEYKTEFVWQPAAILLVVMILGLLLIGWGPGSNVKPDTGDLDT